jgi:hypothetical protein
VSRYRRNSVIEASWYGMSTEQADGSVKFTPGILKTNHVVVVCCGGSDGVVELGSPTSRRPFTTPEQFIVNLLTTPFIC